MQILEMAHTARPLAGVSPGGPMQPRSPANGTCASDPDDRSLARYRAGLVEVGRLLGWTADTTAAFVEDVAGRPWGECGRAECAAIAAAFRRVLDRCEVVSTRRWSGSAPDAGGLPLPSRRHR